MQARQGRIPAPSLRYWISQPLPPLGPGYQSVALRLSESLSAVSSLPHLVAQSTKPSLGNIVAHVFRRVVAAASTVSEGSNGAAGVSTLESPKPAVQIDNQTDPFSTIVSVQYGDRLGELLDTVRLPFPLAHTTTDVPGLVPPCQASRMQHSSGSCHRVVERHCGTPCVPQLYCGA